MQVSSQPDETGSKVNSAITQESQVSMISREEAVAVAAYYLAEHRGFAGGSAMDDWLVAEAEISASHSHLR